ncbi:Sodium/hydrogen exchanger 1 [Platanthera zijinensis]|uniref:Sodium/hydrogen exchanger 1 n=1 Tax=Platanthera zijinensis TaxID=2320716 RepID=A0AAP0BSC4_9ASPA
MSSTLASEKEGKFRGGVISRDLLASPSSKIPVIVGALRRSSAMVLAPLAKLPVPPTCIVIGHLLEGNCWINESIRALFLGLVTGVVILLTIKGKSSPILVFSEDLFFIYLLPAIIFNVG